MMKLIIVTVTIGAVSMICHALIRFRVNPRLLQAHNDVTAAVYATFGVVYAVILGFMVSQGEEERDLLAATAVREAATIAELVRAADALGGDTASRVKAAAIDYARSVATEEWPALANDRIVQVNSRAAERLWQAYLGIQPQDLKQDAIYRTSLQLFASLGQLRHQRLSAATDRVSDFLRLILWVGAAFTVVFMWLFGAENPTIQLALTGMITTILALILIFILWLDNPLAGDLGLRPDAFERVLSDLGSTPAR